MRNPVYVCLILYAVPICVSLYATSVAATPPGEDMDLDKPGPSNQRRRKSPSRSRNVEEVAFPNLQDERILVDGPQSTLSRGILPQPLSTFSKELSNIVKKYNFLMGMVKSDDATTHKKRVQEIIRQIILGVIQAKNEIPAEDREALNYFLKNATSLSAGPFKRQLINSARHIEENMHQQFFTFYPVICDIMESINVMQINEKFEGDNDSTAATEGSESGAERLRSRLAELAEGDAESGGESDAASTLSEDTRLRRSLRISERNRKRQLARSSNTPEEGGAAKKINLGETVTKQPAESSTGNGETQAAAQADESSSEEEADEDEPVASTSGTQRTQAATSSQEPNRGRVEAQETADPSKLLLKFVEERTASRSAQTSPAPPPPHLEHASYVFYKGSANDYQFYPGKDVAGRELNVRDRMTFLSMVEEGFLPKLKPFKSKLAQAMTACIVIMQETGIMDQLMEDFRVDTARTKFLADTLFDLDETVEAYVEEPGAADHLGLDNVCELRKFRAAGKRVRPELNDRNEVMKNAALKFAVKLFPEISIDRRLFTDLAIDIPERQDLLTDLEDVLVNNRIRVLINSEQQNYLVSFRSFKMAGLFHRIMSIAAGIMANHYGLKYERPMEITYVKVDYPLRELHRGRGNMSGLYFLVEEVYPAMLLFGSRVESLGLPMLAYNSYLVVRTMFGVTNMDEWYEYVRNDMAGNKVLITNFSSSSLLFSNAGNIAIVMTSLTNSATVLDRMHEFLPGAGLFWGINPEDYHDSPFEFINFNYAIAQGPLFRGDLHSEW